MNSAANTENILGYEVTTLPVEECARSALEGPKDGRRVRWFACLNPHAYVVARRDPVFAEALHSADLLVADGVGITIAARLLGKHIGERITGSDFFMTLMGRLSAAGGASVFLLGSTEENLEAMRERIARDFPGVRVAGVYSPPFRDQFSAAENAAMIAAINASGADVLWVGMTAPKQEKWIHEHVNLLEVRFAGAIGAVFDYYTGRVRRPRTFFRRLGLEWLVRLLGEPKRLWRRNFVSAPLFFLDVFAGVMGFHFRVRKRPGQ